MWSNVGVPSRCRSPEWTKKSGKRQTGRCRPEKELFWVSFCQRAALLNERNKEAGGGREVLSNSWLPLPAVRIRQWSEEFGWPQVEPGQTALGNRKEKKRRREKYHPPAKRAIINLPEKEIKLWTFAFLFHCLYSVFFLSSFPFIFFQSFG